MKNLLYILITASLLQSCDYFKTAQTENAIARVNDVYLYQADLKKALPENLSIEDSTIFANNFINQWATQQLLVQGAEVNLSDKKLEKFDRLVTQYKNDLYSKAYLEALVTKNLDTAVSVESASTYYDSNKEAFKLNEDLIKFRYINIEPNRLDLESIKQKFKRFNAQDKKELDSIAIQFKSYSLNDSVWIRLDQAITKIPAVTLENKDELLKKSNFIQLKDSLGLYLMQINDVLLRNSTAPLEYVKPTINQIVINKRKLELIKQLEKDIKKDAINNKQFEIYN
ncbi:peptidyl-prolyl cis-trans isomerase [Mesoflavibacter profundi]|uniref:Peptidyl-prolyl cis-trans isomerase n=1 Tax=Mesoflavibacter profundi TaxID=2708110 RepID=A0ABT4RXC4_9FLAO|nr:peptidyl-prolyl cis-trans isomerase [Mesoflavibacter profundi]MDA0176170.1 peptidyl-prolyl cis-trans isomerase [Mesoflavibacter profundi]